MTIKIAAVPTAFPLDVLSINQAPKYSDSKGTCCRHSCILDFISSLDGALARGL